MAKRSLSFKDTVKSYMSTPSKQAKEEPSISIPLSPAEITSPNKSATVNALVASLSPVKPSRYFDGELTDGNAVIRLVGFDDNKRQELQLFCDQKTPVTLRNCLVQHNKFKDTLEVVVKNYTKLEPSGAKFEVSDMKTVGSSLIELQELPQLSPHTRVTARVTVLKVNEPEVVSAGKRKQDVLVSDSTVRATVTLWEDEINTLSEGYSYQLNRFEIRSYLGKSHLSSPTGASVDDISDVEDALSEINSSSESEPEHLLVSVVGVQLETIYTCINCQKNVDPLNSNTGKCDSCQTIQKLGQPKQTGKLFLESSNRKITMRAYPAILKAIAQTDNPEVTPSDLINSTPFEATYDKFNVITHVSRK